MVVGTSHASARAVLPRERVELILSQLDRLPALSAVAARLLAVTTADNTSAKDVVNILTADAALTAAVLRMVQRADLGVRAEGMTASRAVTLLGFNAVRNLVLTVHVFQSLSDPVGHEGDAVHRRGLWMHNLAVACTAEWLAERGQLRVNKADAFVCGLLHDIGKIALDATFPKSYARVIERVEKEHACICDAERELFGVDHTVAGKRLLSRWGLPAHVVECAWLHHQNPTELPSPIASSDLVRLVHTADSFVRQHGIGFSGYRSDYGAAGCDEAGFTEAEQQALIKALPERMQPFLDAIGFGDREPVLSPQSLLRANQELGRINAELVESHQRFESQSAILTAVGRFTRERTARETLADVCVAAAECVRGVLSIDAALVLVHDEAGRCVHVGCARGSPTNSSLHVLEAKELPGIERTVSEALLLAGGQPVKAAEPLESLWLRLLADAPAEPLWLWPLPCPEGTRGAALFSANDAAIGRLRRAGEQAVAPASAIGLALAMAMGRANADRMAEELVDINRRLREAQKLALQTKSISMIAKMADGAAHELNNPLTVISGRAQLALASAADAEIARTLEIIIEQAKRASSIATDLMSFAKPPAPRPASCRLVALLETLQQHWHARWSLSREQLMVSLTDPEVTIYADPQQLGEILTAVVANAIEAAGTAPPRVQINSPSLASDDTVRIVVRDHGVGMTREVLDHAMDPFFSSRPAGRGRGLGLSRAYRFAEINGGRLRLESTPNVGTTVMIELPGGAASK